VALGLLTLTVHQQIATGTELLGVNLSDQTRTFVQLQRETLRLLTEVARSGEEFDVEATQFQYDLVLSRINHMNREAIIATVPDVVAENIRALNGLWDALNDDLVAWLAAPDDLALRGKIEAQLIEFEQLANTTEIEFNRSRTLTLTEFAHSSQQLPLTFGFATVIMITVMIGVLLGVYLYIRQVQVADAARHSSEFKDQFLAVMSHELRTPLNAIIGFLGIMKMTSTLPDKTTHMVDRSRANAERLLTLIDDILDLSKIQAGRFEIHPEVVNPRELFARWQSQTEILALQKNIEFTVEVDHKLPTQLYLDPDSLTKVVTNLLSNAFKFTSQGGVYLRVYTVTPTTWAIEVRDTGIGIPPDKLDTVFESFRQVDGSVRRAYGGTGLGLSIVKQLTQLIKGQIKLQSEVGKGSVFTVSLPLVLPDRSNETVSGKTEPARVEELNNAYSK
jgi:signal transduction histidine kinase